jgi:hypothetical protein
MVLETVAIETLALAATDRISSAARCFRLRMGVFGMQASISKWRRRLHNTAQKELERDLV